MKRTVYQVINERSYGPFQEFTNKKDAEFYSRVLNDRYENANARVVKVRASRRAREHYRNFAREMKSKGVAPYVPRE